MPSSPQESYTPSPKRIGKGRPKTLEGLSSFKQRAVSVLTGKSSPRRVGDESSLHLDEYTFDSRRASAPVPSTFTFGPYDEESEFIVEYAERDFDWRKDSIIPDHSVSRHHARVLHNLGPDLPTFSRPEPVPLVQELARMQRRDLKYIRSTLDIDDLVACRERDSIEQENIHAVRNGLLTSKEGKNLTVFGTKLREVVVYASIGVPFGHYKRTVPYVAMACIEELYRRGLNDRHLFCATKKRDALFDIIKEYNSLPYFGKNVDLRPISIECVCSLLMTFLSGLPEPLITTSFLEPLWSWCLRPFLEEDMEYSDNTISLVKRLMTRPIDLRERVCVQIARTLLLLLPSANLSLLLYLMTFLNQVHQHGMEIEDIAALFGASVFGARHGDVRTDIRASLIMCWFLHRWQNISATVFGMPAMYSVDRRKKIPSEEWEGAPSNIKRGKQNAKNLKRMPSGSLHTPRMTPHLMQSPWSPQLMASPVLSSFQDFRHILGTPKILASPALPSHVLVPRSSILAVDLEEETVVVSPSRSATPAHSRNVIQTPGRPIIGLGVGLESAYGGIEKTVESDSESMVSRESTSSSVALRQRMNVLSTSEEPPRLTVDIEAGRDNWNSSSESSDGSDRPESFFSSNDGSSATSQSSVTSQSLMDARIRIRQLERELIRCDEVVADAIQETFEERKRADALNKQIQEMRQVEERRTELLLAHLGKEESESLDVDVMKFQLEEALVAKDNAEKEKLDALKRLEEFERLIEGRESLIS